MRWLKLSIGLVASAGFVWLLVREVDLDALGGAFAGLSVSTVLLALTFLAAGWAVRIVRWWWMLRALEPTLPLGACAGPFLAGMAVNNVAPFRAGDAVRVLGFRRQLRAPAMAVAGTLVIERVLDVAVLTGVFFLGLLGLPDGVFPRGFVVAMTWLAGCGAAAVLVLPLLVPALGRIRERLPGRRRIKGRRWAQAVSRHGAHLAEGLRLAHSRPRMLVLIGLSAAAWACEGAVFATVAAAVRAGAEPMGPWFSLAAGTLATAIPSAPGHIGTFDWFAAQGLEAYGASAEVAIAFALTVHAVLWVSSTAAGLFFLLACGIRPQRVRGGVPPVPGRGGLRPRRPSTTRPRYPELPRRQRSGREPRGRPDASDRDTCHGPACRPHRAAPEVSAT